MKAPRSPLVPALLVAERLALRAREDAALALVLSHPALCSCSTCESNAERVGDLIERFMQEAHEMIERLDQAHQRTYERRNCRRPRKP